MVFALIVEAVNGVICEVVFLWVNGWCDSYVVSYRLRLSTTCGEVALTRCLFIRYAHVCIIVCF